MALTVDGPNGIVAGPGNSLVVADGNNNRVLFVPLGGSQQVLGFSGLVNPYGVAIDSGGNVYASDATQAVKIPAGGGAQVDLGITGLNGAAGLALDAFANVFVANAGTNEVLLKIGNGGSQFPMAFSNLSGPKGTAVDAYANVYAVDTGNNRVIKLPAGQGAEDTVGFTGLTGPKGVTVDGSNNIYAADTGNNRILKLAYTGGAQTVIPFTGLSAPAGVAIDNGANVYVADAGNSRVVVRYAASGVQATLPFTGLGAVQDVAVDTAGTVYVADTDHNRIVKLPSGGTPSDLPFVGLSGPYSVAVDRTGNVYAADTGNNRIVELPAGGGAQIRIDVDVAKPKGVAVDNGGNVFASSSVDNIVFEVPPGGGAQRVVQFSALSAPDGVGLDVAGDVFVADTGNNQIKSLVNGPPLLRVTTNPPVPADISIDGVVRDTWGINWAQFPIGNHEICFGPVPGFTEPQCKSVTLSPGQTTTWVGNYTAKGYLHVTTSPIIATTILVDGSLKNDYGMWTEVPVGSQVVSFTKTKGYNIPADKTVTVTAGQTTTYNATFTANANAPGLSGDFGTQRVTTDPPVNAQIFTDGTYRNSWGLDWMKNEVGTHQVCFGPVLNMIAPPCQTVQVANGATTFTTGTYTAKGFLRVITRPPVPANIYINNQVANSFGAWPDLKPGTYKVCFGPAPGYKTPPCQAGQTVTAGNTTTVTGVFTPL